MKIFKINKSLEIVCEWKKTRNGFKHEATLVKDGKEIDKTKINYLNRTWESYDFESIIHKLLERCAFLTTEEIEKAKVICSGKAKEETNREFGLIANIAKLGEILGKNQTEKNDWKARMIKAGLGNKGLIMPEDWDTLDEDDKQKRLDGVIKQLTEKI